MIKFVHQKLFLIPYLTASNNLKMSRYKMMRANHPNNVERGILGKLRQFLISVIHI